MKFDPRKHHRHSIRLKDYDYAQPGAYFVTLCTSQRDCLFGKVVNGVVRLNPLGKIVEEEWERLGRQFPNIRLDAFVVMPNHVHGIIVIDVGATQQLSIETVSGKPNMHIETGYSHDGSPKFDRSPEMIGDGDGAPENDGGVGATHNMQTVNLSGNHNTHIESGDPHGGSPGRETAEPLNRKTRATRHSPTGASIDNRYGATKSEEWVDGSPLRNDGMDRAPKPPATGSLGAMIGQFKSRATKRIWAIPEYSQAPIWQRNYYEHIIRNEAEWGRISEYIHNNPFNWGEDQLHPAARPNPINQDKQHG